VKEIIFQKKNGNPVPFSEEDKALWAEYKENRLISCKTTGIRKQRSYEQLKLIMKLFRVVASNTDNVGWNTKEKVQLQAKLAIGYLDTNNAVVKPDGTVHIPTRSFSYKDLKHMEACNVFDRVIEVLAKFLGITVEELINNQDMEG